jgi:hypothetical protein
VLIAAVLECDTTEASLLAYRRKVVISADALAPFWRLLTLPVIPCVEAQIGKEYAFYRRPAVSSPSLAPRRDLSTLADVGERLFDRRHTFFSSSFQSSVLLNVTVSFHQLSPERSRYK